MTNDFYIKDVKDVSNQENVIKCFEKNIGKMKKYFTDDYEKRITDNTVDDETLAAESDKAKITEVKTNLENTLEAITSDSKVVEIVDKKEIENYTNEMNALVEKYNARIKIIEEEEAKKAAEEERKRQEAAAAQANTGNSYADNGQGYYESGNGGYSEDYSSGGNTGNNGYVSETWGYITDPNTGEKHYSTTYVDGSGNVYDANGNYLYNLGDWTMAVPGY